MIIGTDHRWERRNAGFGFGTSKASESCAEVFQKIVAGWKVIVGQTTAAFKQALLKSIPKYNGETGDPVLYVEFQTPLGRNYPDDSDACRELKQIIETQTGKSVELHMLVAEDHQQTNLVNITVDQAIRENIHMDVVIEENRRSRKRNSSAITARISCCAAYLATYVAKSSLMAERHIQSTQKIFVFKQV